MKHKHLTIEERENILVFLSLGETNEQIGIRINRHKSTITRELQRNTINGKYSPSGAEMLYKERKAKCGAKNILECNSALNSEIKEHLENKLSPEAISGRMKLEEKKNVSFKTIYRGIKNGIIDVHEKEVLVRKGKVRPRNTEETRGKIVDRKPIEERPTEANERLEIGHYELDTVIGKDKKGAILTCVDRVSRFLIASLMPDRKAETFTNALIEDFKGMPLEKRKTFTSDNGKEFSRFKEYEEALGMNNYFANPYHSWERGTNENTNGILRRYFPKGTDFLTLTESVVSSVVMKINLMPKKCLGWMTPFEVHWGEKLQLTWQCGKEKKYSRTPVYDETIDNIVGILYSKDIIKTLNEFGQMTNFDLKTILREAYHVPSSKRIDELFKEFQKSKNHVAIVLDEYGGTAGLVSLEDLLEEIVGNIFDEDDEIEYGIKKINENTIQ